MTFSRFPSEPNIKFGHCCSIILDEWTQHGWKVYEERRRRRRPRWPGMGGGCPNSGFGREWWRCRWQLPVSRSSVLNVWGLLWTLLWAACLHHLPCFPISWWYQLTNHSKQFQRSKLTFVLPCVIIFSFVFSLAHSQQKTDDDDSGNDEPSDLAPPDFKDYFFQGQSSQLNSPEGAAAPQRPEPFRQLQAPPLLKIDRYVSCGCF